jgi:hypothetical protein
MEKKATRFLGLHIPAEVKEQLEKAAHEQTRSVSAQALHYLKLGLKADGKDAE